MSPYFAFALVVLAVLAVAGAAFLGAIGVIL